MSRLIKIDDGFCWWDVTDKAEKIFASDSIELYILYDDRSESLIESIDELIMAKSLNLKIVMELGFVSDKPNIWNKCKRILNNGHWYIKLSDALKTL
jgi:hypothetical protein